MATVTKGRTFVSGETVTPTKLNELVDLATVTAIQTADISDSQITTAKIADAAVTTAKVNDSAVTTAKINNAAVTAAKLDGAQTGSAPIYGCRAWVNFDGTKDTNGNASTANTNRLIRASGNVSSVLRTATGTYTVTFTTAMQDANYVCIATPASGDAAQIFNAAAENSSSSQAVVYTADSGFRSNFNFGTPADLAAVYVAIFR